MQQIACVTMQYCFILFFFLPPNSSLWIISHWISCRIGIFCSSCCTGWTLGDCAWQSSLWRYYRASAWLQSSSIFVSPSLVLFAAWHVCSGAIQILTRPLIPITFVCVWPLLFLKVIDPKIFIMHAIIIIFFNQMLIYGQINGMLVCCKPGTHFGGTNLDF